MTSNSRPRSAMIVLNTVANDSRVLKGAWYLADHGWDVAIVGWSPSRKEDHLYVGRAHIIRVVRPAGRYWKIQQVRNLIRKAWIMTLGQVLPGPSSEILRPIHLAKIAMTQAVVDFNPDVIHAQDFSAIPIAVAAQKRILKNTGKKVPMIYDAHEFLPGQANIKRAIRRALISLERKAIHAFDHVVTVSPIIAEKLRVTHGLKKLPVVVTNDPVLAAAREHSSDIRTDAKLADSVPLMVYSGGIAPQRGIMDAVSSLEFLPEHHLVIMAPGSNAHLEQLIAHSKKIGVEDRVHVLPFVANAEVTSYLRTADIGLIMNTHHVNHEMSTPTKFSEYAHANIPIVGSDVKFLAEELRRIGNGEVYISGDVQSFVAAVKKVTSNPAKYIANYSKEMLNERSWETQSSKLLSLYGELTGLQAGPKTTTEFSVSAPVVNESGADLKSFIKQFD